MIERKQVTRGQTAQSELPYIRDEIKSREIVGDEDLQIRNLVESKFANFYDLNGYEIVDSIPLIPGEIDETVCFTGATINGWKEYLKAKELPERGIATVQPCLRTHNASDIYKTLMHPKFGSYFTMGGVLTPPGRLQEVLDEASIFLTDSLKLLPGELQVHFSSEFRTRIKELQVPNGVRRADDLIDYYNWEYGIDNVFGEGVTIDVLTEDGFQEIGNVVLILKGNEELAVEWGFGLETLTSRILGLEHPIYVSPAYMKVSKVEEFSSDILNPAQLRFVDAINAISAMLETGVYFNCGYRSLERSLEKYANGVTILSSLLNVDGDTLRRLVEETGDLIADQLERETVSPKREASLDKLKRKGKSANRRMESFMLSFTQILKNPVYSEEKKRKIIRKSAKRKGFGNPDIFMGVINSFINFGHPNLSSSDKDSLKDLFEEN